MLKKFERYPLTFGPTHIEKLERLSQHLGGQVELYAKREDVTVGQKELLQVHEGTKTESGFRENIRVGVQYIEAWLRGRGAVPVGIGGA